MTFFTASDGASIAFHEEGAGRPLLLLHGLMANGGFFDGQRALADDFRLIRLDLRGHGASFAGSRPPTVARAAEDVAELVEHLDLEGAVGIGWSLGATVLWRVLSGHASRRFAGAVIVDMSPCVRNQGGWELGLSPDHCEDRTRAIREDFPAFAAGAGAAIFAQPLDEAQRPLADWVGREFARCDRSAVDSLWKSLVEEDSRPLLGAIRQPTLVVHGAQSHLYGADTADHLVEALPSASALRFERSGHAPHLEQPELFNAAIRDFAAMLPPVPTLKVTA
ncbi:MAG TPA: alpha/beta hydrolase [Allosphingosinicella sp.]